MIPRLISFRKSGRGFPLYRPCPYFCAGLIYEGLLFRFDARTPLPPLLAHRGTDWGQTQDNTKNINEYKLNDTGAPTRRETELDSNPVLVEYPNKSSTLSPSIHIRPLQRHYRESDAQNPSGITQRFGNSLASAWHGPVTLALELIFTRALNTVSACPCGTTEYAGLHWKEYSEHDAPLNGLASAPIGTRGDQ